MTRWPRYRQALDRMVDAYLEAADWTDTEMVVETLREEGVTVPDVVGWHDDAIHAAEEACRDFLELSAEGVVQACLEDGGWSPEQAGHDLWLTRNGHGAGFWDRGREHGDRLSSWAHSMGSSDVWIDADGWMRLE